MKVLHVINSLGIGGAEKLITETLPLYNKAGITADLVLLRGVETHFLEELRNKNCCKIYILGKSSPYNPLFILQLIKIFRNYELIHSHLFPSTYFCILAKLFSRISAKVVFTEHSTSNRRFRITYLKPINNWFYKKFDKIICITEGVKAQVLKQTKSPENKLIVINNGLDIKKYEDAEPMDRKTLHPSLQKEDVLLVQVSSFRPQKDQITLIKALSLLPPNVKLLLVGEGDLKENCCELVKEMTLENRVLFFGNRIDVAIILKTADIVVLSSIYEGLSLSSIEGMASGRPFIASNVLGLKDIVSGAGILFE
ncbi:MAG: glycosyltransferase, partial [Chryseobacterium sp.]|nr:glycosyltransferase [Chryseobacterium sp.]